MNRSIASARHFPGQTTQIHEITPDGTALDSQHCAVDAHNLHVRMWTNGICTCCTSSQAVSILIASLLLLLFDLIALRQGAL